MKKKSCFSNNYKFTDSLILNNETFCDYLNRFKKLCLSIFEWVNLPPSMNSRFIEQTLYYDGKCAFLKNEKYGFINTRCVSNGNINIYGLPTKLNCYSYDFNSIRTLYTGLRKIESPSMKDYMENNECILVQNDWDMTPTCGTMELFALRLTEAERTCDVNIKAQKTPILIGIDEKQRLMLENMLSQYEGNSFAIVGSKDQISLDMLKTVKTDAPFVADKIIDYKKEIWNEALTFLGINNILVDKKERLITDEANSNNELINLNLQSYLAPRQEACKQFNEKFGFTGTDKEISVRVRSDLHNVIKNMQSVVTEYNQNNDSKLKIVDKEGEEIG